MRKIFAALLCALALRAAAGAAELKTVERLNIAFSPYDSADAILSATRPMGALLQDALKKYGYDVKEVSMAVSSSYDACAEALSAGSADVGFISGGVYALYSGECEILLTALRRAYSKDSTDPRDWNDGIPAGYEGGLAEYYRCVILAGPSPRGRELAAKVNAGGKLSWGDLSGAVWCVLGASSSSGYIYPCLWLQANYGKSISDLPRVIQANSHGTAVARLAAEQADVIVSYAHVQRKFASEWVGSLNRPAPIWEETNVIGVTEGIYNDAVCISASSPVMDEDFKKAVGQAFIDIGATEEGQKAISAFSQVGFTWGRDENYDGARRARDLLRSMK